MASTKGRRGREMRSSYKSGKKAPNMSVLGGKISRTMSEAPEGVSVNGRAVPKLKK